MSLQVILPNVMATTSTWTANHSGESTDLHEKSTGSLLNIHTPNLHFRKFHCNLTLAGAINHGSLYLGFPRNVCGMGTSKWLWYISGVVYRESTALISPRRPYRGSARYNFLCFSFTVRIVVRMLRNETHLFPQGWLCGMSL